MQDDDYGATDESEVETMTEREHQRVTKLLYFVSFVMLAWMWVVGYQITKHNRQIEKLEKQMQEITHEKEKTAASAESNITR